MKTLGTLLPQPNSAEFRAEAVIKMLGELQPKQARVVGVFSEIFPALRDALKRGVSRKVILQQLAANGVKLNTASFKRLFDAEEKKCSSASGKEAS